MRVAGLFRSSQRERELDAEIESHLQLHIDDNLRAGMPPDAARRAAFLKFGHVEAIKDAYRDQWGIPHIDTLLHDVRYAFRRWCHRPGFGLTAILILGVRVALGATPVDVR